MQPEIDLKPLLDRKAEQYNQKWFIQNDPISVPHRFIKKEDIEISAFLTAILSWGQRPMIIKKAGLLMDMMDNTPYDFITGSSTNKFARFGKFVYRTFNGYDCQYFVSALREIYRNQGGLEHCFLTGYTNGSIKNSLVEFRKIFMSYHPLERTGKHLADVLQNSSAKRLNMFLRWMVRTDGIVDFGLWQKINQSDLMVPLDVHVGRTARRLGILTRKQNDWKAVEELSGTLRSFKPDDPVFYDYALFGIGIYDKK